MTTNKITSVSDNEFDEKIARSGVPAVVDFWAPWCEPCKLVHPIIERLAERYRGKVGFFKMNVDEEKNKPSEYAIRSIPTLLFFKDGTIKNQLIGVQSEDTIEKAIENLL